LRICGVRTQACTPPQLRTGRIDVAERGLVLPIGRLPIRVPLAHRDGDLFTYMLDNENAAPGTISKGDLRQ